MKPHQNRRQIWILAAMMALGSVLSAMPEIVQLYTGITLPLYFMGSILVTILCGLFFRHHHRDDRHQQHEHDRGG